jgi:hypothetical protein
VKTLALSALIALTATSALAQTKVHQEEYYVVRDSETKTCTIVDKRPATITSALTPPSAPSTIVGLGVFKTQEEAEAGMKKMDVCDDEDTRTTSTTIDSSHSIAAPALATA